jgi:hypothetical protein
MSKAEELLSGKLAAREVAGKLETLQAPPDIQPGRLADVLMECFGADDDLDAVEIVLGDRSLGYLERAAAFGLAESLSKSVGVGDYNALPGAPDYRLITLGCPVDGCGYRLTTVIYDEDRPPICPRHQGQALGIQMGR